MLDALCRIDEVRPGRYRLLTACWITPDGAVEDVPWIGRTGRATVRLIDRKLLGFHFRELSPESVQPGRLLFVP
ncbi:hypothetical protein [Bradyrhizobium sp. USDA 10063]